MVIGYYNVIAQEAYILFESIFRKIGKLMNLSEVFIANKYIFSGKKRKTKCDDN